MAESSETILSVRNLVAHYETRTSPVRAVDDVTFSVKNSEILGIAGESGCGKSTLAAAVTRLLKPPGYVKEGQVIFNGVDLLKLKEKDLRKVRWKHIAFVPQGSMNSLNPIMRIDDQVVDAIKAHEKNVNKSELRKRVKDLLSSVGLVSEVASMHPHELSGGMKQRVIIAMATALSPEVIIADEPTTALDVVVQRGIVQLFLKIRRETGCSILLITHDMGIHAELSDRLAIMYAGKIVEIGKANDLFGEPLHPYSKALISAIPSVKGRKRLLTVPGLPPDLRKPPPGCRFYPRCQYVTHGKCDFEELRLVEVKNDRFVACHLHSG